MALTNWVFVVIPVFPNCCATCGTNRFGIAIPRDPHVFTWFNDNVPCLGIASTLKRTKSLVCASVEPIVANIFKNPPAIIAVLPTVRATCQNCADSLTTHVVGSLGTEQSKNSGFPTKSVQNLESSGIKLTSFTKISSKPRASAWVNSLE